MKKNRTKLQLIKPEPILYMTDQQKKQRMVNDEDPDRILAKENRWAEQPPL
jgi:hypothetical protein